ncbi:MAG: hypothetical protein M0Z94_17145 [Dehalococcoidales bacterium]|nr:hypothetical protein [Dehalococcoidales bacterium]
MVRLYGEVGAPSEGQVPYPALDDRGAPRLPAGSNLLRDCPDQFVQGRICRALRRRHLLPEGLALLCCRYGLTWKEVDVFVAYYLGSLTDNWDAERSFRRRCAEDLLLSENTLRCHIKSLRRKLGITFPAGSFQLYLWAHRRGLVAGLDTLFPSSPEVDAQGAVVPDGAQKES